MELNNAAYLAILVITLITVAEPRSSLAKSNKKQSSETIFQHITKKYGLPLEERNVITQDGYILKLNRVPGNQSQPILLVHGLTPDGDCWIIREENSMVFMLAKRGYDVWVINLRGTRYSRRHLHLNPDTQPDRFFNYSFYEQGVYDLPATIDVVLRETGQQQLILLAQSLGTTVQFVMGSERPEYNYKIKVAFSLSPVCFLEHLRGLFSFIPILAPYATRLFDAFNMHEVMDYERTGALFRDACTDRRSYEPCIRVILPAILGYDEPSFEPEFVQEFLKQFPAGTSTKMFKHIFQLVLRKDFVKYDYGAQNNRAVYNSTKPPRFDLSRMTMKTVIMVGKEDYLSTVKDSERLNASLPNVVHYQVLPYKWFNHFDFMWGRQMNLHLYPYFFKVLENFD